MIHYGKQAVAAAEKELGRPMNEEERCACYLEGYADEIYLDTKGIETFGMGQTGEWIHKGLEATLFHHFERVRMRLPEYTHYPVFLRKELYQAEYRGDLGHSPNACGLIRSRQFAEGAKEFLDNDEYRAAPDSIRKRMQRVYHALMLHDLTREV